MQSDLYRCSECSALYDRAAHIPKLVPTCGHTFCSECLSTMINKEKLTSCPLDNITLPSLTERSDQFPTNLLILQVLDLKMKRDFDTCEKHGEPKILVCLTDCSCICKICQEEHKDHTIKHIKDVKAEAHAKMKQLQLSLDEYKAQTEEIERLFEGTRKSLATFFKNKFDEMRDALTRKEKEFFQEIDHLLENERKETEKKLKQDIKVKSRMEAQVCDLESNILNQRFFRTLLAKIPALQATEEIERLKEVSQGLHKQYEPEIDDFSNLMMSMIEEFRIKKETSNEQSISNSELGKASMILKNNEVNEIAKIENFFSITINEEHALVVLKESDKDSEKEVIDFTNLNHLKQIEGVYLILGKQYLVADSFQAFKSLWKLFGEVSSFFIHFSSEGFHEKNLTMLCSDPFWATNQIKLLQLEAWNGAQGSFPHQDSIFQSFPSQIFQKLKNLVYLQLGLRSTSINDTDINALFSKARHFVNSLEIFALNLNFTKITDKSIRILTDELPVESLYDLTLFLKGCKITDSSIKYFCDCHKNSFKKIKKFALDLSRTNLTNESIFALQGFLPSMRSLDKLLISLCNLPITDAAIIGLLLSLNENIKSLEEFVFKLNTTPTSDGSIEYLANHLLPSIPNLKSLTLELDNTQVTDQSLIALCQNLLKISKNLEFLLISACNTNITEKSIAMLINSLDFTSLPQPGVFRIRLDENEEFTLIDESPTE